MINSSSLLILIFILLLFSINNALFHDPTPSPTPNPTDNPTPSPTPNPTSPTVSPTTSPTTSPTPSPTFKPSQTPSSRPSSQPSMQPSSQPSRKPSSQPSSKPSSQPTSQPSSQPSRKPSSQPSSKPSSQPTSKPSSQPSLQPSTSPTSQPSSQPSTIPTFQPSSEPSSQPSLQPSCIPTAQPTLQPSSSPTSQPTNPTSQPTNQPSSQPSQKPSCQPSLQPSSQPSSQPSRQPSLQPTSQPSTSPTTQPSCVPTLQPFSKPTSKPSSQPSVFPSAQPTNPSSQPTRQPTSQPSRKPSSQPSRRPSSQPSGKPSLQPSSQPSSSPSSQPITNPTSRPSSQPTSKPSRQPSSQPSSSPSKQPTSSPTSQPSIRPSSSPTSYPFYSLITNRDFGTIVLTTDLLNTQDNGNWLATKLDVNQDLINLNVFISNSISIPDGISIYSRTENSLEKITTCDTSTLAPCTESMQCVFNVNLAKYLQQSYGGSINITFAANNVTFPYANCGSQSGGLIVYEIQMTLGTISDPTFQPTALPLAQCKINSDGGNSTETAYIIFAALFAVMGIFLYIIRKASKTIYQFSVFTMVFQLSVLGLDLISDLMYIAFLYAGKIIPYGYNLQHGTKRGVSVTALATTMLVTRLIHPIQTAVIANGLMGRSFQSHYVNLMDKDHFVQFGKEYGLLMLVSLFESTAIKFFPWLDNDFIRTSGGYPTPTFFRLIAYGKIFGSIVSALVQLVVIIVWAKNNPEASTSCILLVSITFATSLLIFFITAFELYFQSAGIDGVTFPIARRILRPLRASATKSNNTDIENNTTINNIEFRDGSIDLKAVKSASVLEAITNPLSNQDSMKNKPTDQEAITNRATIIRRISGGSFVGEASRSRSLNPSNTNINIDNNVNNPMSDNINNNDDL